MKIKPESWAATARSYLLLGLALSTWSLRPPTEPETQMIVSLLRDLCLHEPGRRPSTARAATCCDLAAAACCPAVLPV